MIRSWPRSWHTMPPGLGMLVQDFVRRLSLLCTFSKTKSIWEVWEHFGWGSVVAIKQTLKEFGWPQAVRSQETETVWNMDQLVMACVGSWWSCMYTISMQGHLRDFEDTRHWVHKRVLDWYILYIFTNNHRSWYIIVSFLPRVANCIFALRVYILCKSASCFHWSKKIQVD